MTSCCMCPSDTISPFPSFPGHHSQTCQGRGQVRGILHSVSSVPEELWYPRDARAPSSPDSAVPVLWPKPQALVSLLWPQRRAPHTPHTGPGPCVHAAMDAPNGLHACSSKAKMVPVLSHAQHRTQHAGAQPAAAHAEWRQAVTLSHSSARRDIGSLGGLSRGTAQPAPSCTGGGAEGPLQPHSDQVGTFPKRRAALSLPLPITTPTSPRVLPYCQPPP